MKLLPTQRVCDSIQVEVDKSKEEIHDMLRRRMKNAAHFTDDNTVIRMAYGESYSMGTGKVGFSISRNDAGKAILRFDFYTRYPSILKTLTLLVTAFFTILFLIILFLAGSANLAELFMLYLKFMLILPVLIILFYLHETTSRYNTKRFIQHVVRDLPG